MLSLLNKSGGDKAAAQATPWRPNFRDTTHLPDTKTVRTNFFVNLVALVVTGALAIFVGWREWEAAQLRSSLADVETRIEATRPGSEKAQATYKLFQAEEKKFNDAYALVGHAFRFPDFVLHLGELLPPDVNVRRIDFRGTDQNVLLTCSVKGLDAAASDLASNFVKQLQEDKTLAEHFSSVALNSIGQSAEEGRLNFELVLTFKTPAKSPAKTPAKK